VAVIIKGGVHLVLALTQNYKSTMLPEIDVLFLVIDLQAII